MGESSEKRSGEVVRGPSTRRSQSRTSLPVTRCTFQSGPKEAKGTDISLSRPTSARPTCRSSFKIPWRYSGKTTISAPSPLATLTCRSSWSRFALNVGNGCWAAISSSSDVFSGAEMGWIWASAIRTFDMVVIRFRLAQPTALVDGSSR